MTHAAINCSAFIPWYRTNPIAANGAAPSIHTQLTVSVPKYFCSPKYSNTATPTASIEKMNCRMDSPKKTASVYSLISFGIFISMILLQIKNTPYALILIGPYPSCFCILLRSASTFRLCFRISSSLSMDLSLSIASCIIRFSFSRSILSSSFRLGFILSSFRCSTHLLFCMCVIDNLSRNKKGGVSNVLHPPVRALAYGISQCDIPNCIPFPADHSGSVYHYRPGVFPGLAA